MPETAKLFSWIISLILSSFEVTAMVMSAPVLQIMKLKQRSLSKVVHLLSGSVVEHCRMARWDENLEEKKPSKFDY